jgi:hypothetical protein
MAEFTNQDLRGSRFEDVHLGDAEFHDVALTGARLRLVDLSGVQIRGAYVEDVEISGEVLSLVVNGVDVAPLAATVERARRLPEELLHERVDDEWSFVETLRHLVFATDAWVRRALLGDPSPWDPLDLPHDEMPDTPGVPRDRSARPSLDEVLALRADRMATVRGVLAELTDEQLAGETTPVPTPVPTPGYPESEAFPVRRCLGCILSEEWEHRGYAERDLAVLESRG